MSDWPFEPCSEWAERLAMNHSDDLSSLDANALERHMGTCSACAKAHAEYLATRRLLRELPDVENLSSELPPWLQRLVARQMLVGRGGPLHVQKTSCTTSVARTQSMTRTYSQEVE